MAIIFIYLLAIRNTPNLYYVSYLIIPAFAVAMHAFVCLVLTIIYKTTKIVSDDLDDYVRGFFLSFFLVLLIGFSVCSIIIFP